MSESENAGCTFECQSSSVDWTVLDAHISEELNHPYEITLSLVTEGEHAHATEMLAQSCTVTVQCGGKSSVYPAVVHRVEDAAGGDQTTTVWVQASAALGLLSRNRQTRIFQNLSVPEILRQVLEEGLGTYQRSYRAELERDYPTCEYRVQYDESDLSFCRRLMEEEGIAFRFDRSDSEAEVLLLTDDVPKSSGPAIEAEFAGDETSQESVTEFARAATVRPNKLSMRHYNWTNPSLPIEEQAEDSNGPSLETYHHDALPPTLHDYSDGDGYQSSDVKAQCRVRRELDASEALVFHGSSKLSGFSAGECFKLTQHPLEDDYLLVSVDHSFTARQGPTEYTNGFTCIPRDIPYRPPYRTAKPRVLGLETATVVGPSNQEIHTDRHGRVKVQFHWDREGQQDDHSSCFIRVVQPWAGAGWGFVFLPRVGMEVTVAFLHGDPDRPIITGCVYNGANLTPYEMPGEMTKSTIRTQSSLGGDGYNELTFEDKAGEEEVFLQAQKNLNELVKNDHATSVGNDQSLDVGNDQTETVGNDQTISVGNDQSLTITKNQHIDVGEDKSEKVGNNLTHDVGADLTQTVGGSKSEEISGSRTSTAGESWSADAGESLTLQSGKDTQVKADKNMLVVSDEAMDLQSGKDFTLNGKAKGTIKIQDELRIEVGQASITLKSGGDIVISGGKIEVKGQSDVVIKGAKTSIN